MTGNCDTNRRSRRLTASAVALVLAATPAVSAAHELPVGDGKVTTTPKAGNVFACQTQFRGGGARHTGAWFHGDTWDPTAKPHVEGKVTWSNAQFSMTQTGNAIEVSGNGLPVGEPTGKFPISPSSTAYQYDTNPNSIRAQSLDFRIPLTPVKAAQPSCVPMGMIGFTTTGVALYNALDDGGRDAAAHEVQDLCDGHPQNRGQYHYHSASPCIPGVNENKVVGWALDGYPILGMRDASGALVTDANLDACHGRAESVTVDGRHYDYAYRMTEEYPYIIGCFVGQVQKSALQGMRAGLAQGQRPVLNRAMNRPNRPRPPGRLPPRLR